MMDPLQIIVRNVVNTTDIDANWSWNGIPDIEFILSRQRSAFRPTNRKIVGGEAEADEKHSANTTTCNCSSRAFR